MNRRSLMTLVLALGLMAGCERAASLDAALGALGPHGVGDRLAWVVSAEPEVILLQPGTLELERLPLPAPAIAVHPEPGGRGLLVLHEGAASWITLERGRGRIRHIELSGGYEGAVFAPEGDRAVLREDTARSDPAALANPNRIAIVELATGEAVERTLRSYGSAPSRILIAPRRPVAGVERQLAWVLAERYLSVLDLSAPEAKEVVVHLVLAGDPRPLVPTQVVFADVAGEQTAFVRAQATGDVFSLTFPERSPAGEVPRPYLNQLPAGAEPQDLVVEPVREGSRIFAVAGTNLAVIDPATAHLTVIDAGAAVDRILPFAGPMEGKHETRFALLWSPGDRVVVFADLDDLEQRRGRALTPLVLSTPIAELYPLPGRRAAVARFSAGGLAILDFELRTATPMTTSGTLTDLVVHPSGDRFFVGVSAPGGALAVISVEVETGTTHKTPIPAGEGRLILLAEANRLVVVHPSRWGDVSVIGDEGVARRQAILLEGVFR